MARGHAEMLIPIVLDTMREAGLAFDDLGGLGVTIGPGSFTGVRIGLAAARGLALASGLPLAGLSTFRSLERSIPGSSRAEVGAVLVVIDSKRRDVYAELFDGSGRILVPGAVTTPERLVAAVAAHGSILVVGDAAGAVLTVLRQSGLDAADAGVDLVDPAALGRIAIEELRCSSVSTMPRPIYLRAADVTLPPSARPGP